MLSLLFSFFHAFIAILLGFCYPAHVVLSVSGEREPLNNKSAGANMNDRKPGNTWRFFVSLPLMATFLLLGYLLEKAGHESFGRAVCFGAMAFPFLGGIAAQLSTGYSWKNLAPGNRGVAKTENPTLFWLSIAVDGAVSLLIIAVALWSLVK
jgi:hypothetical protein